jgi:NH3-dependent NAD+ synthetase
MNMFPKKRKLLEVYELAAYLNVPNSIQEAQPTSQ